MRASITHDRYSDLEAMAGNVDAMHAPETATHRQLLQTHEAGTATLVKQYCFMQGILVSLKSPIHAYKGHDCNPPAQKHMIPGMGRTSPAQRCAGALGWSRAARRHPCLRRLPGGSRTGCAPGPARSRPRGSSGLAPALLKRPAPAVHLTRVSGGCASSP